MIIIDKEFNLDIGNTLSHMSIPFRLDRKFDYMNIKLLYNPRLVPKEEAKPLIEQCINRYLTREVDKDILEEYKESIEIENLITISLFYEGKYIGAWHNKSNNQDIIISEKASSLGFVKTEIKQGNWEAKLNFHSVNTDVEVKFMIELNDENEVEL